MISNEYMVSSQWLAENLDNPDVKIIDCRFRLTNVDWGYQEYLKSHIPGAYYFDLDRDLSSAVQEHGGRHPLPDANLFAQKLEKIGIVKNKTEVIVYDDLRFAFAARLWWLLRYFGHQKVALLDGGWNDWLKKDYPTTSIIPESKKGFFEPQINPHYVVDIDTVKQLANNTDTILIDSRSGDRYRGENEPIDPVAGHISGAVNHFWQDITDSQGYIKSIDIQKSFWQPLENKSEIIVYCGSGVTACVNILSLQMSGLKNIKLYAGGWSDWCSYFN